MIDFVKPEMSVATEEIFGPAISIMRTDSLDEALKIENENPYGNAASVFTIGRRGALYYGTRFRRNDRREHWRSSPASAVFIRRLERIAVWCE